METITRKIQNIDIIIFDITAAIEAKKAIELAVTKSKENMPKRGCLGEK